MYKIYCDMLDTSQKRGFAILTSKCQLEKKGDTVSCTVFKIGKFHTSLLLSFLKKVLCLN